MEITLLISSDFAAAIKAIDPPKLPPTRMIRCGFILKRPPDIKSERSPANKARSVTKTELTAFSIVHTPSLPNVPS